MGQGVFSKSRVLEGLSDLFFASGCIRMLEAFDFRGHFCLVFDLLGMSMYDFLRCRQLLEL